MSTTSPRGSQIARRPTQHPQVPVWIGGWSPAGAALGGPLGRVDGADHQLGLAPEFAEAGAAWWFELLFGLRGSHAETLYRVRAGPPR